jgi:hypothetical protein
MEFRGSQLLPEIREALADALQQTLSEVLGEIVVPDFRLTFRHDQDVYPPRVLVHIAGHLSYDLEERRQLADRLATVYSSVVREDPPPFVVVDVVMQTPDERSRLLKRKAELLSILNAKNIAYECFSNWARVSGLIAHDIATLRQELTRLENELARLGTQA